MRFDFRGYRDGAFTDDTAATVLEQCFHDQKSVDVLQDEDRKLCGSSLSWKWGEVAGVELGGGNGSGRE